MSNRYLAGEDRPMTKIEELKCVQCGRSYAPGTAMTCPACGLEGILEVRYGPEARFSAADLAGRPRDLWRYRELLPVELAAAGSGDASRTPAELQVGWTPVYDARRLAEHLGIRRLWIKDDGRNPTASFKDRASALAVMAARQAGAHTVACASTGNAASSLAGFAAATGLEAIIFVPERAPEPKVAQLTMFGARVLKVQDNYDRTWDLCQQACGEFGWYNRNAAVNPYLVEGKKTAGLEIAEQLGEDLPDWIAVSVGDGCTIAGVWKGLVEMHRLGLAPRLPRLLGVQAEGARAVADAFARGEDLVVGGDDTMADSIAVGHPRNWRRAVRAVRESGGTFVCVSDAEILDAMRQLARKAAVFGEPAAAASLAGLGRAVRDGILSARDTALTLVTGNGLKDTKSAIAAAGGPTAIAPRIEAVAEALAALVS